MTWKSGRILKLRYPIAAVLLIIAACADSSNDASIPDPGVDAGPDAAPSTTKPPTTGKGDDDDADDDDDDDTTGDDDDDDVSPPPKDAGKDANKEQDAGNDAEPPPPPPPPAHKRVFVTKQRFTGNLGGRAGADAKCNDAAAAANLQGGPWIAWVSTNDKSIIELIADKSPWYLVNDTTMVFKDFDSLKKAPPHRIDMNENGTTSIQGTTGLTNRVWTATTNAGLFVPAKSCGSSADTDWNQDTTGSATAGAYFDIAANGANNWTRYQPQANLGCDAKAALYCFEQ